MTDHGTTDMIEFGWHPDTMRSALKAMLSRVEEIVLRRDFEFSEFSGALLAVVWGLWLYLPYKEMAEPFEVLDQLAAPFIWASAFVLIGMGQLFGLVTNRRNLRRRFGFAAVLLWTFIGLLIGFYNWHLPTFPMCMAFACGAAWGFLRIGHIGQHS